MTASLTVLAGPLAGTRLEIDDAADEILVGSDPDCRFCLDAPGVSPIHARLWLDDAGITVHDTRSPRGLYVNEARVEGEAPLRDGDVLSLGTPGDDASVQLRYLAHDDGAAVEEAASEAAAPEAPPSAVEEEPAFFAEEPPAVIDDASSSASMEDLVAEEAGAAAPSDAMADLGELLPSEPAAAPVQPPEPAFEPAPEAAFEPAPEPLDRPAESESLEPAPESLESAPESLEPAPESL